MAMTRLELAASMAKLLGWDMFEEQIIPNWPLPMNAWVDSKGNLFHNVSLVEFFFGGPGIGFFVIRNRLHKFTEDAMTEFDYGCFLETSRSLFLEAFYTEVDKVKNLTHNRRVLMPNSKIRACAHGRRKLERARRANMPWDNLDPDEAHDRGKHRCPG